jgi:hypothetical protein
MTRKRKEVGEKQANAKSSKRTSHSASERGQAKAAAPKPDAKGAGSQRHPPARAEGARTTRRQALAIGERPTSPTSEPERLLRQAAKAEEQPAEDPAQAAQVAMERQPSGADQQVRRRRRRPPTRLRVSLALHLAAAAPCRSPTTLPSPHPTTPRRAAARPAPTTTTRAATRAAASSAYSAASAPASRAASPAARARSAPAAASARSSPRCATRTRPRSSRASPTSASLSPSRPRSR